jgi:hypothetical protein
MGSADERPSAITKILSRNDTGETGGHQAGILIPREERLLAFFPGLDGKSKNPRHELTFRDPSGQNWIFAFIYYNNRFFGGTRNEYRLTRMTSFIRAHNLRLGDEVTLSRDAGNAYHVNYKRSKSAGGDSKTLKLGTSWREIRI